MKIKREILNDLNRWKESRKTLNKAFYKYTTGIY